MKGAHSSRKSTLASENQSTSLREAAGGHGGPVLTDDAVPVGATPCRHAGHSCPLSEQRPPCGHEQPGHSGFR